MKITEFVEAFRKQKFNVQVNPNAIGEYIKKTLEVKTYLPFAEKRHIVEMVVDKNTEEIDGVWKNDQIGQYVSFIVAMLHSHTSLEFSDNPVDDYDTLSEMSLLMPIIETFRADYNDCETLLRMETTAKLEDNNINMLVGKFLYGLSEKLDVLLDNLGNISVADMFGGKFNEEDLAKLSSFLNKYNK
jgi:hypothetical protein